MKRTAKRARSGLALLILVGGLAVALSTSCSGNPRVSAGVGIHRDSSGNWGHSLSVGVHSNRW